jgi:hypothetical protein
LKRRKRTDKVETTDEKVQARKEHNHLRITNRKSELSQDKTEKERTADRNPLWVKARKALSRKHLVKKQFTRKEGERKTLLTAEEKTD